MLISSAPICLIDKSLAIYRMKKVSFARYLNDLDIIKLLRAKNYEFIRQFGYYNISGRVKERRIKRSYRRKEGNGGFVVFMANKVDVTTLVQIFQLSNKDNDNT